MEKFSLKWNDFQTNVSDSFNLLRTEQKLFDVTLVSDDEVQISAHKLVLAASSSFFKSIFTKNPHSQPLIYLSGVDSLNIGLVLDYIYNGEVQIFQEQLDSFLHVAQKFKISGLMANDKEETKKEEPSTRVYDNTANEEIDIEDVSDDTTLETISQGSKIRYNLATSNEEEIKLKVKELITKDGSLFTCQICSKSMKEMNNMKRHVETHIDGVAYECQLCTKSFRSKHSLSSHMSFYHKRK